MVLLKEKVKKFMKENGWFFISLILIIILFNYHLPYYIDMPGGIININDRIECDSCSDINGSLNMLYVSEYEATIPTYLLSYIIPNWDLEKVSEQQLNDESMDDIYTRNRLMLENSIDNATYVAYKEANKEIELKDKETLVIATTMDNGLKIGDKILEVDGKKIDDVNEIREIIKSKNINDVMKVKIIRDDKEKEVNVKIKEEKDSKMIGVVIVTNFDYETNPDIEIKFKSSESGSSGGFMMALSIYTKISDNDIVKGRKIAGTGTIEADGTVGEIDGIKYKIMGASKNKIDIVLVPSANYKEAIEVKEKYNYDIEIVKIDTFSDAIKYLESTK